MMTSRSFLPKLICILLALSTILNFNSLITAQDDNNNDDDDDDEGGQFGHNLHLQSAEALSYPPPVVYENGPEKCKTNYVKCKEIIRLNWCAHFCLWVFQGYIILNVTFSVFIIESNELSFELGPIMHHPDAIDNPPDLDGPWKVNVRGNAHTQAEIKHFRYSWPDDPQLIKFKFIYNGMPHQYAGNIVRLVQPQDLIIHVDVLDKILNENTSENISNISVATNSSSIDTNISNMSSTPNPTSEKPPDPELSDENKEKLRRPMFEIRLWYNSGDNNRDNSKSIIGYTDIEGRHIIWTNRIVTLSNESEYVNQRFFPFFNKQFDWQGDKPKQRNCWNFGPLGGVINDDGVESQCGQQPQFCSLQMETGSFVCSKEETEMFNEMKQKKTMMCPYCHYHSAWRKYSTCVQQFRRMKAEGNRCAQLKDLAAGGPLDEFTTYLCDTRLQVCIKFRSAKFLDNKIQLCPEPTINIITNDKGGSGDLHPNALPGANPIVFGCITIPVTHGLLAELNPGVRSAFVNASTMRDKPWYVIAWEWFKFILFSGIAAYSIMWILKSPQGSKNNLEYDDAKFFEEYGDFFSEDEPSDLDQMDEYDHIQEF